jgi:hypothetical protein
LEGKPEKASDLIKFLNSRSKEELKDINIEDRTSLIMDAKKVLAKRKLMQNTKHKVHELTGEIVAFKKKFSEVVSFGLPNLWDGNGDLYLQKNYHKLLDNRRNDDSRFSQLEGPLKGQDVMDMLAGDFTLLYTLKMIFKNLPPPSYERFTDLDELKRNLNQLEYPMGKVWKKMCQYLKYNFQDKVRQVACTQPLHK